MNASQCPHCGSPTEQTLGGLCPACLIQQGVGNDITTPLAGAERFLSCEQLGQCFPELEFVRLLGFGGMGAVYLARQKKLDRFVAFKVLHPESAKDPSFAERFEREAKAMAKLSHAHIVTIHDFDHFDWQQDGEPLRLFYIMMEYIEGADLRTILTDQKLQPQQTLEIIQQVCEALQFAHNAGVVHRDIKPENILLDSTGNVRIADFGLAKLAERAAQDLSLTGTHQVVGTPKYMAPEQLEGGKAIDHRADLYSLGVVFYEMLTGELPLGRFDLPSESGMVDARMDQVVLRTLAREPGKRYQQASEIRDDVRSLSNAPLAPEAVQPLRRPGAEPSNTAPSTSGSAGFAELPTAPQARAYSIAILVMSLMGALSIFLPFTDVIFTSYSVPGQLQLHFRGYHYLPMFAPALLSTALAIVTYGMLISRSDLSRGRAILTAATGFAMLFVVLLTVRTLPVLSNLSDAPSWGTAYWSKISRLFDRTYDGRVSPELKVAISSGVLFFIMVSLAMIAASAWELTTLAAADQRSRSGRTAIEPVVYWLKRSLLIHWWSLGGLLLLLIHSIVYLPSPTHEFRSVVNWISGSSLMGPFYVDILILLFIGNAFTCLVGTPMLRTASRRLDNFESIGLVRAACILLMLPISPGVVFGIPIAIWAWLTLRAPSVHQSIESRHKSVEDAEQRLDLAASRLAVIGIIHAVLIGFVGVTVVSATLVTAQDIAGPEMLSGAYAEPRRPASWIHLFSFGLLGAVMLGPILQFAFARAMRNRSSLGMAKLASWLALVPMGPGWFFGLTIGLDTLCCLKEPVEGTKDISDLFE